MRKRNAALCAKAFVRAANCAIIMSKAHKVEEMSDGKV